MNKGLPPVNAAHAPNGTYPIAVVLSYYEGDRAMCKETAKLMADLQPHHVGDSCVVILACRQDCKIDKEIYNILLEKFFVLAHVCQSPLRGWPDGPNGMFGNSMQMLANSSMNIGCIFWMEADCVPTRANWFAELHQEWMTRHPTVKVMGHRLDCNGNGTGDHITGCAVYDRNFARIIPEACSCAGQAWDYAHRSKIVSVAMHTEKIKLAYHAKDAKDIPEGPCLVHGFKDYSLLNLVRAAKIGL